MRREDITRDQTDAIKQKIRPMLAYLNRLKRRMNDRKFPHNDPLFNEVVRRRRRLTHVEREHSLFVVREDRRQCMTRSRTHAAWSKALLMGAATWANDRETDLTIFGFCLRPFDALAV
jgi:hypothetical protein